MLRDVFCDVRMGDLMLLFIQYSHDLGQFDWSDIAEHMRLSMLNTTYILYIHHSLRTSTLRARDGRVGRMC